MIDSLIGENTQPDNSSWREPPEKLALLPDEIHVWRASLDVNRDMLSNLEQTLSADEQEHARTFHFPLHASRFRAARGILRKLLASYLALPAGEICFSQNKFGKPFLNTGFTCQNLRFNVSHSEDKALFAFSEGREVGVDLEKIKPGAVDLGVAERFFSPRELEDLAASPSNLRDRRFFEAWTRKEAYVKARGLGLTMDLKSLSVRLAATLDMPAKIEGGGGDFHGWVVGLVPFDAFVGAVAGEGPALPLRLWHCELWRQE